MATVTALCPAGLPTSAVSVRGIFSQGVLGRLSAVSPGQAAVAALDGVFKVGDHECGGVGRDDRVG